MSRPQRLDWLVFCSCFFAFAYFNQGGGWNQNARFAEVRAIVEEGRFAIDNYLVYQRNAEGDDLVRIAVDHAEYTIEGQRYRLCWVDMEWTLYPIGDHLLAGAKKAPMVSICCSGDIGYVPADGHFHPNKPPGTQLLAVPGYFVIYHLERWLGINPDHWWYLNFNAWLTSVCSVGLLSAIGCVLFCRLARELADGAPLPALLATFAFAFGTTFFPFGTILFDHNLTASLFIATYYGLRRTLPAPDGTPSPHPLSPAYLAGFCAGLAVLTNYPAALGVFALGFYAWLKGGVNFKRALVFCAGGVGPALVLCLYTWVCYGGPFKLSNDFQSPLFRDDDALFGMFRIPRTDADWWRIVWVGRVLIYSPFRGLFFLSPVLLLSFSGLATWWRRRTGDALLCLVVFGLFFVMNMFFNGFHAGFSAGPRYLVPGLPFLALPLVVAFQKWPRFTGALAALSIGLNLLLTATDGENPTGVGGHARIEDGRDDNTYNLVGQYAWPLFLHGEARPLLRQQDEYQKKLARQIEEARLAAVDPAEPTEQVRSQQRAEKLQMAFDQGQRNHETLLTVRGPLSVNPIGVFEGMLQYDFFEPRSRQCRWASFNLGEFLWPESRWSLLPLLLVSGGLGLAAYRLARREALPS